MSVTAPGLGPDRCTSLAACFLNWVPNWTSFGQMASLPRTQQLGEGQWGTVVRSVASGI